MSNSFADWERLQALFHQVRDLDPARREQFIEQECGHLPQLRDNLRSLLWHADSSDSFLESPEEAAAFAAGFLLEQPLPERLEGQRIGSFQIVRFLATGGMGVVYEALQESPRRTVALKLLRQRWTGRAAYRRFQQEVQILGNLSHPGVAQIFEAGVHRVAGVNHEPDYLVPYFAMEMISGAQTLTEHAREKQLSRERRIALFVAVCEAVQHGHQKGVIHRDLKPANLLVDQLGCPKIIDFGVARATDPEQQLTTTTTTDGGQLAGTLHYMSPEQFDTTPGSVDVRSDLFSLGVVLYELLTDRFPYEVPTTNLYQAAVIIRERPARRPSEVDPSLRGDLEVILLKALEKEPDRRYGSAAELAQDLRRFLDDEPILARRPGPWEQIARWSRRHRWAAITVLLLVLALIAGTAGTSLGYLRATQAHAKAVEREHEAQRLREVARQEADRAEELSRFLMHMIAAPQPDELGADTRVVDVLSRVEGNLAAVLSDRPVLEASMRSFLGVTFVELSMPTRAEPHLRRGQELLREHRGESHLSTLLLGQQLAGCLWYLGRYEAGSKLARHSLDLLAESNVDSPRLRVLLLQAAARCQLELFDLSAAQKLLQESLALFDQFEPSSPNRSIGSIEHQLLAAPRCEFEASTYNELAKVSERQWLYSEAAEYYRRSLAVLEGCSTVDASSWIHTQSRLAQALVRCGEFSEAEQLLRPCIRRHEEVYGVLHAETLFTRKVLAGLLLKVDRLDEAERLFEQVRSEQSAVFGEFATETLVTQADLGKTILASRNQERTADGLGLLEEAYELQAEEYGSDHYGTLYVAEVLSDAYEKEGHLELLLELVEEARRAQPTSMVAQLYRRNLRLRGCSAQTQLGQFHESESELLDLQAETESAFGEQHPRNREVLRCLAGLYFAWGKPDKEEHYLSRWRALARTQE